MIDSLTYEEYKEHVNTNFQLPEIGIELELIEVLAKVMTSQQEMFSLIFRGAKDNFLEQKTYQLRHEKLGDGDLFLVPLALDSEGYKYEAGFNRLIDQNQ